MTEPDFDFGFGNGRYLKGHGWRGLVALGFFLSAAVVGAAVLRESLPALMSGVAVGAQKIVSAR